MMMMTVAANSAPQASPTMGVPNQTTGAVTVRLNATDADGNPLSYSISSQPSSGSVQAVAVEPGRFTYTPTAAARVRAGTTAGADFDTFTVTVSDGQVSTPVTVQVPVLPAVLVNNNTTGSTQASPIRRSDRRQSRVCGQSGHQHRHSKSMPPPVPPLASRSLWVLRRRGWRPARTGRRYTWPTETAAPLR